MPHTRRDFCFAALLPLAAGFASTQALPGRFPTAPRERIGVATYPFRRMIVAPHNTDRTGDGKGYDLAAFAGYIRSEFDVQGIEPLHSHFPSVELAEVRKLRQAFDDAGVRTINIPVDEDLDLGSADPAVREHAIRGYRRWIDIAVILGSPSIRIAVPKCGGPGDIAGPIRALKPVVDYARSQRILICFENDDPLYGTAARIVTVLQAAKNPWLRALPDFANSLMGGDARFNTAAVQSMFAFASSIAHVKDAEVIQGQRRTVNLAELFAIAKAAHFRGYWSMESDSDADPVADTKQLIAKTVALMA